MVPRTLTSASQALQPAALTWRTERAARSSAALVVEGLRERERPATINEVVAAAGGEAVILRERDGALRADFGAIGAEEAAAEVEADALGVDGDRARRARVEAHLPHWSQREESSVGRPRKRSGRVGAWAG